MADKDFAQQSSVARGDAFRDTVLSNLSAAGFICQSEVRAGLKKADGCVGEQVVLAGERYDVTGVEYWPALMKPPANASKSSSIRMRVRSLAR